MIITKTDTPSQAAPNQGDVIVCKNDSFSTETYMLLVYNKKCDIFELVDLPSGEVVYSSEYKSDTVGYLGSHYTSLKIVRGNNIDMNLKLGGE